MRGRIEKSLVDSEWIMKWIKVWALVLVNRWISVLRVFLLPKLSTRSFLSYSGKRSWDFDVSISPLNVLENPLSCDRFVYHQFSCRLWVRKFSRWFCFRHGFEVGRGSEFRTRMRPSFADVPGGAYAWVLDYVVRVWVRRWFTGHFSSLRMLHVKEQAVFRPQFSFCFQMR